MNESDVSAYVFADSISALVGFLRALQSCPRPKKSDPFFKFCLVILVPLVENRQ